MNCRRTIPLPFRQGHLTVISNGEIATLAQLVEHSPCKRTVVSSSLTGGSISIFLAFIVFLPALCSHPPFSGEGRTNVRQTAETVLIYQRSSGGWPKGYDRKEKLSTERKKSSTWLEPKERSDHRQRSNTHGNTLAR